MDFRRTALAGALLGAAAIVGVFGVSSAVSPATGAISPTLTRTVSIEIHPTQLLFISPSGATSAYPTGPLPAGSRVLGYDTDSQNGRVVGQDFEVCTVSFNLNALCDDMVEFAGQQGNLRVSWTFQWPSTGTTGPQHFDGVVMGGTGSYRNAQGAFHAVAIANNSLRLVAVLTTPA